MAEKRKTVLIVAYACEPNETSEPGVGWNFSKEIARSCHTIVLTRKNNRKVIESGHGNRSRFIYYDLPRALMTLKKKTPLGTQWYYALWQWGAYRYAKRYISKASEPIDLVHHLNFAMTWLAPPAYLLKKPFVWGPVGGGDHIASKFFKGLAFKSKVQESFYFLLNQIGRFSIFSYLTRKKADAVLFRTESAIRSYPGKKGKLLKLMSETASVTTTFTSKKAQKTVKAICVGRLFYWKGFMYAVRGFHVFLDNGGDGTLEIFGDGPEKERIEAYIKLHSLETKIFLRGFVDNDTVKQKMEEASVLLHPSFRDGGSWSIMEAMSFGLPVVCLDTSGPKDMVTKNCGMLIELVSPGQIVNDICKALFELRDNTHLYERLSANASERIKVEYNWKKRGEQIVEVYHDTLRHAVNRLE